MKRYIFLIMVIFSISVDGQVTEPEKKLKERESDTISCWNTGGSFALNFSQSAYINWTAGGQDAIALNSVASYFADYQDSIQSWDNSIDVAYGLQRQDKLEWIKTDDKIEVLSKYGRKISKLWYYAGLLQFRSQFTEGFNYPNDSVSISEFMSPGYVIAAIGLDFKPGKRFSAFIAPVTGKLTTVFNQRLADQGAYGVEPGDNLRVELGGYIRMKYNTTIVKNITLLSKLDLFSNYLDHPENIDINWETVIGFKVNSHISASITTHLIYDSDIDIEIDNNDDGIVDEVGPRTQFKEVLGIGFNYSW